MVLLKIYPEEIFSHAAGQGKMGFMYANFKLHLLPKVQMIHKVAYLFGGLAAEELIFGKDYVTSGSEGDLDKATAFVANMIRNQGLGVQPASIQAFSYWANDKLQDNSNNKEVREWLIKGKKMAIEVLKEHSVLLLELADYLSDRRTIKKSRIKTITRKTDPVVATAIDEFTSYHEYRSELKGTKQKGKIKIEPMANMDDINLNKRQ